MPSEIRKFDKGDSTLLAETKVGAIYELAARMAEAQSKSNIDNPSNPINIVTETQTNENGKVSYVANFAIPAREVLTPDGTDSLLKPRAQLSEYMPWTVTTGDLAGTNSAEEALDRLCKQVNVQEKRIPVTNVLQTPNTISRDPQPEQGQLILGITIGLDRGFDDTTGRPLYNEIDHLAILDYLIDAGTVQ